MLDHECDIDSWIDEPAFHQESLDRDRDFATALDCVDNIQSVSCVLIFKRTKHWKHW